MTSAGSEGRHLQVVLLAACILVGVAGGVGAQAPADDCNRPNQMATEADGWTRIKAPGFAFGSQLLLAYAVDPIVPDRMFVTNGKIVMRSSDGGCTWAEAYRVGGWLQSGSEATVTSIVITASAAVHDRVYLLVGDRVMTGNDVVTRVVRSVDGGTTWTVTGGGLPLYGRPLELAIVRDAPGVVYVATANELTSTESTTVARGTLVYVSRDAGESWRANADLQTLAQQGALPPIFEDIEVDPVDPETLWGAAGLDGLWKSSDGGRRWTNIAAVHPPSSVVEVFRRAGPRTRVWAFGNNSSFRSDDGGQSWDELEPVFNPDSATGGAGRDQLLVGMVEGNTGWALDYTPGAENWEVIKQASPPMWDLSADSLSPPAFYARGSQWIWRSPRSTDLDPPPWDVGWDQPDGPVTSRPGCASVQLGSPPKVAEPRPATLSPRSRALVLRSGESAVVPYELRLPKDPTPVDIFFLIDASNSMGPGLCGAAHSSIEVATTLVREGIDARFGVGTYQQFNVGTFGMLDARCRDGKLAYAYRRDRHIQPLSRYFAETLLRIVPCAGDNGEPQMTALYQAATGEGQPPWIDADQGANFRREAHRLIVHVADEYLTQGSLHKTLDETVTALKKDQIRQVGVALSDLPAPWLRDVARGTEAIAEEPGVDCDGDGAIDVDPGEPLVCVVREPGGQFGVPMAKGILGSVLALGDDAAVRLVEIGDSGVVASIDPDVHPDVNLRQDNLLRFDVTYTCAPGRSGVFPVDLEAQVGGAAVTGAVAVVTCNAPFDPPIETPPPGGTGPVPGGLPPPPPPPAPPAVIPGPIPAPAPAPAPQAQAQAQAQAQSQSQSQSQSQMQAQAGMVTQRQEQPQAALVRAADQLRERMAMESAMSRLSSEKTPPVDLRYAAGGAALMMMSAWAYGWARARRLQRAWIRG